MSLVSASDQSRANLFAIGAIIVSQAVFTANDALMKLAARSLPGGEAIFVRGLFTVAFASILTLTLGAWRVWPGSGEWRLIALRNVGEVAATLLYLTALFHMPIAEATAILQFVPLAMTAGAALFLAEPVGWRRWLATAVGLVGVLVVIRPGTAAFNGWSLVALASVMAIVLRDLATRRIGRSIPTIWLTLISSLTVTSAAATFSLTEVWRMPSTGELLAIGAAAVFLLAGYYSIIEAMRLGEVAVVAPFRYSIIVWAILAGLLLFGERPDPIALAGTGIVMAAGLYTFFRERRLVARRRQQ
ncbi:MAG: DMT family transporter [Hyphomicrobiaceae bacterium]